MLYARAKRRYVTASERARRQDEALKVVRREYEHRLKHKNTGPMLSARRTGGGRFFTEIGLDLHAYPVNWGRPMDEGTRRIFGECVAEAVTESSRELTKRAVEIMAERVEKLKAEAEAKGDDDKPVRVWGW